jgi:anti-anti-sigma regulatory factor
MASQLLLSITATRASLHLIGEFDLAQRWALRARVAEAVALCGHDRGHDQGHDRGLDVDASKVTFVDCGTLRELARAHHELSRRGGRLTVRSASGTFRRVATLAGYPELVPARAGRAAGSGSVAGALPSPRPRRVPR